MNPMHNIIEIILNTEGWTKVVVSEDYIEAVKTVNLDSHMTVTLSLRVAPVNASVQWNGAAATTTDGAAQFAIALASASRVGIQLSYIINQFALVTS